MREQCKREEKANKISLFANKGITMVSLVVTIIVLLILASITIGTLKGKNSTIENALDAKQRTETKAEMEMIEASVAMASAKNKYGNIELEQLDEILAENFGPEKSLDLQEFKEGKGFILKAEDSKNIYEISNDGTVTYLGQDEGKLAVVTVTPKSGRSAKESYNITAIVKTLEEIDSSNIEIKYGWSNKKGTEPETYQSVQVQNGENSTTKTASINTNGLTVPDGKKSEEYYLYVKVKVGEDGKEEIKSFGPYKVGEGGQYWTTTQYSNNEHWVLAANRSVQEDNSAYYWPLTYFSFPVRPVTSAKPDAIKSISFDDGATERIYGIDGMPQRKLQKGLNIIRYRNGKTRKLMISYR